MKTLQIHIGNHVRVRDDAQINAGQLLAMRFLFCLIFTNDTSSASGNYDTFGGKGKLLLF